MFVMGGHLVLCLERFVVFHSRPLERGGKMYCEAGLLLKTATAMGFDGKPVEGYWLAVPQKDTNRWKVERW